MKLPVDFLEKMKGLLGEEEYKEFLKSYDMPRYYGLRVNTLKTDINEFLERSPFELKQVPWAKDGFYYPEGASPGKHPYYYAGLYYIQEPSAMMPGAVLGAEPGEFILDLCAAPGGKTVQIAAAMQGKGLLVANDINSDRVKALVKNIELCGIRNAIVTNETPERLANKFGAFFDRILIDAPCSGEGMFRKDEEAARSWEKFKCEKCVQMQENILTQVDRMLKPGGTLVCSTCTFSPEEDEIRIAAFLDKHPDYEIVEIPKADGIANGRPEWGDGNPALSKTARLWPHKLNGEGHFVAKLKKSENQNLGVRKQEGETNPGIRSRLGPFYAFVKENLTIEIDGNFDIKGDNLYNLPVSFPDLSGLKIAKFGWYLGEFSRDRFEPSHSFVISLKCSDIKNVIHFSSESTEVIRYLKGETLMIEGEKGMTAICVDGYTLGWAKQTGDMLKNLYPKGWRRVN